MLKKTVFFLGTFSSLITSNLFANGVPYVGASLGVVTNTSDLKIVGNSIAGNNFRGMPLNVFAGYGGVVSQNFYLGGEVFGTLATGTLSSNSGLKSSYGYGISVNPGMMLSDHTLTYLRFGGLRSRFPNQDQTLSAGQFGAGIQTSLTQNVDLRLEYNFVAYRSFNYTTGSSGSASIAPRSDQFNLGLVYTFD